jgi:inosose dehydratase
LIPALHIGGGNAVEGIRKYAQRIWHVHFKDTIPGSLPRRLIRVDYVDLERNGIFELGQGDVDLRRL